MYIGIDVGGTNLDAVLLQGQNLLRTSKLPVDHDDLLPAILASLDELLVGQDSRKITRINLSTTISTNAIATGKTAQVGLIVQPGPGYAHDYTSLVTKTHKLSGYVDHRGFVVQDLDQQEVNRALQDFKVAGLDSLAIVTKFSPRNPQAELAIAKLAQADFPYLSLGHQMSGKLNFPRRVNTTIYNSAVLSLMQNFLQQVLKGLEQRDLAEVELNILKADGGTMTVEQAFTRASETILSGPAASLMGTLALLENQQDAIVLDIGGTTTDLFFIYEQKPLFASAGAELAGQKTLIRALYTKSIALGGDSSIELVGDQFQISKERLGPAACLGGVAPTVTDALVVLGKLDLGEMALAEEALASIATPLGLDVRALAQEIVELFARKLKELVSTSVAEINNQPLYTVREVLAGKRFKPQELRLIGGPVQALAPYLEAELGLSSKVPDNYTVANAIGAALAIPSQELNLHADTSQGLLHIPELSMRQKISPNFSLKQAEELVLAELAKSAYPGEIVEAESFRMIDGWHEAQNIRVKGQIIPGLAKEDLDG